MVNTCVKNLIENFNSKILSELKLNRYTNKLFILLIYCNCFFTLTHSNGHGQSHRKSVATKAIEKDEFNLFFQIDRGNELNKFCPPNRRNDLCICFCLHPSSMGDRLGV